MTADERQAALAELAAAFHVSAELALALEAFFLREERVAIKEAAAERGER